MRTSLKTGSVVFFLTAVFILALFSGSTHSLTYLKSDETRPGKSEKGRKGEFARGFRAATSLRVTLLPLRASGGEVPAGAHGDLQAGGAAAVGQAELQLSGHAVKEGKLGAGAAVAALRRLLRKRNIGFPPLLCFALREERGSIPRDWAGINQQSVTHPLSSRVLRTKGGFFLWPGGRAVQVAVLAFLEKVGKTGTFIELQIKKKEKEKKSFCCCTAFQMPLA